MELVRLWKHRFDRLTGELRDLAESVERAPRRREDIPTEFWTSSDELFISNDMEIADNEEYALKHWGPGKYRRFVLNEFPDEETFQ